MELRYVKGVSEKRISDLNKMGIYCAEDLARHFPRSYLDLRKAVNLNQVFHNDFALIKARIVGDCQVVKTRSKLSMVKALAEQNGELFNIVWFNQPYVSKKLERDGEYLFYGRVRNRFGQVSMSNPTFELVDKNINLKGIIPVYSVKGGLTQRVMRSIICDALSKVNFDSVLPEKSRISHGLIDLKKAFYAVHNPLNFEELNIASDRIALEEYYVLISAFKIIKGDKEQARYNYYNVTGKEISEFANRFGFEFTKGQKLAVNEIFVDLSGPKVMNRLLQGDVGSGKTAVSLCAMYMALKSGYQAVMLAPTEVLAKQNYELIKKYLPEFNSVFLSGSVSKQEKTQLKSEILSGNAKIVCGTHAVLEDSVQFKNLALCVCDEQQRFGVSQRSQLLSKGTACDVLVMSATPIPRTLSLIFYGDLDISTITDKPKMRESVQTRLVPQNKYDDMLKFVKAQIEEGRQVFFVCPKIEGDLEGSVLSVTEIYDELRLKLPSINFAMLHGKMKDKEKTEIMLDFKAKKIDALVSTTVIEVGIDVPNATVMIIYSADRFGLSQLHQLRGRVGRSDLKSYCFLLSDSESEKAVNRLKVMVENEDGFKISECDFNERGGGDFLGTRQSGKAISDLGALKYSSSVIFLAKKLSDDSFLTGENFNKLKRIAMEKYNKLKDITLN